MENQLIQIYLFVCQIYDTCSDTCFQRMSNNGEPLFTDQELITIWFFAHLNGLSQKKQMHTFIKNYWSAWFPRFQAYQTFVHRLNLLEPSFQTFGKVNRLVSKFRQPIESLFNWIIEKTNIQRASKVRSTSALLIHCWGKLAFAFFLLVFYYWFALVS